MADALCVLPISTLLGMKDTLKVNTPCVRLYLEVNTSMEGGDSQTQIQQTQKLLPLEEANTDDTKMDDTNVET